MNIINRKFLWFLPIVLSILIYLFSLIGCTTTQEKISIKHTSNLNLDIKGPDSFNKYAIQLRNNGEIEAALQLLDKGIKKFPANSKLKRTMSVLLLQARKIEKAETLVLDLIEGDKNEPGLHLLWGYILKSKNNNDDAITEFQTVLKNASSNYQLISAHLAIAAIYEELHVGDKAGEHYQRAIALDASLWNILKNLQIECLRVKPSLSDEYNRFNVISAAEREKHFRKKISEIIDGR